MRDKQGRFIKGYSFSSRKGIPNKIKKGSFRFCLICNKEFYNSPSRNKTFCSNACSGSYKRGKQLTLIHKENIKKSQIGRKISKIGKKNISNAKKGNKNPNYINGNYSYRTKALDNLPLKCNRCGFIDKRILLVHHINRNRADNKLENLEILCLNCHAIEHKFSNNLIKKKFKHEEYQ